MGQYVFPRIRKWLKPPHPTWQSKASRNRVFQFLCKEQVRSPDGLRLNVGSASRCFDIKTLNLDIIIKEGVDIQGDLLCLPMKDESVDTIVCTGVLEHVADPYQAVQEIYRILKFGGSVFMETPFMQTVHASPKDFYRWTPDGLRQLMGSFDILELHIVAGPASAFAWQFQETMAMLFSMNNEILYKIGLRIFGWLAIPVSWLDILLEKKQMAWHAASGFALVAVKYPMRTVGGEKHIAGH
ncbi:MAG: class I SAM-dependent methyltransferase [Desulfobacterales bacterium]|nr:class I SAM-dependent methyltransferase [Desulfobacterales bacterium]